MSDIYKSPAFMSRFAFVGENVQVFANALILKPEVISLANGVRIDDYARIEGGEGLTIGAYTYITARH